MTETPDPKRFTHVTDWVFDLDNTLYPHKTNLFSQIDVRMTAYVSELLQLSREEARKLQKQLYLEYGTTMNGLIVRHGIDPDDFLNKVHDIDYSWVEPDPALGSAMASGQNTAISRALPSTTPPMAGTIVRTRRSDTAAERRAVSVALAKTFFMGDPYVAAVTCQTNVNPRFPRCGKFEISRFIPPPRASFGRANRLGRTP